MADMSYLFGGTTPTSMTSTLADSSSQLPAWLQEMTRGLSGQATAIAGQGYQTYAAPTNVGDYGMGTRIANQDPLQTMAYQQTQQNVGNYQPYLNYASQTLPQATQAYMSPYTDQVVNRIADLGQRNLSENLLPQVNQTFTGAGQFGGTRNAEFTNRAMRDANESILGQQSQALQTGYGQAQNAAMQDMQRQASLGQLTQQLGAQQAGLLETAGLGQQGQDQRALDLAYNDFLQQRDYQKNQLGFLSEIVRGLPSVGAKYTSSSTAPALSNQISPLTAAAQGFIGSYSLANQPQQQQATK
jgi:hypothetical protein